ncbi:MAG: hypothetical protein JW855_04205 [Gammaproteobacteria bacterium]|nr:hypothetical protein [Gammaproteobacteria bacterium]
MKKIGIMSAIIFFVLLNACTSQTNSVNQVMNGPSEYNQCMNIKRQLLFLKSQHTKMSDYELTQRKNYLRREYSKMDCDTVIIKKGAK